MKRVGHRDEPIVIYHPALQFPLARFSIFQLIVLVLRPTPLLFRFTLTTFIIIVCSHCRQLFQ